MSDHSQEILPEDLYKYWTYEGTFLWTPISELEFRIMSFWFKTGLKGRIQAAKDRIQEIKKTIPADYVEQKEFLEAVVISLEAVIHFAKRYSELAGRLALKEKKAARKAELREIARICEWVPEKSAENIPGSHTILLLYPPGPILGIFHAGDRHPNRSPFWFLL